MGFPSLLLFLSPSLSPSLAFQSPSARPACSNHYPCFSFTTLYVDRHAWSDSSFSRRLLVCIKMTVLRHRETSLRFLDAASSLVGYCVIVYSRMQPKATTPRAVPWRARFLGRSLGILASVFSSVIVRRISKIWCTRWQRRWQQRSTYNAGAHSSMRARAHKCYNRNARSVTRMQECE